MYSIKAKLIAYAIGLAMGAIIAAPLLYLQYCDPRIEYVTIQEKTIRIKNIENKTSQDYLIYTDKGVFEVSDQLFYMKFNSSDIYAQLKVDSKVQIKVCGRRVPFFSMYPNIIKVIQ